MTTINSTIGTLFKSPGTESDKQPSATARDTRNAGYAEAVSKLTQPMTPESLKAMTSKVLAQMTETPFAGAQKSASPTGAPTLAAPVTQLPDDPKKAEDTFTLLMAKLIMLLGNADVESMKSRLEMLKSMANAAAQGHALRSEQYASAMAELEAALASASTTEAQLQAARDRVNNAQQHLDSAEAALAGLDPESPEYQTALQVRDQARAALQQAQQQLIPAMQAHEANVRASEVAMEKVQRLGQQLEAGIKGPLPPQVEENMKRELDAASKLSKLMMEFAALMGKSQENKLLNEQEMFKEMQAARQAFMEKKSDEYLAAVKKAEQAKKVAGCIGKIFAAVVVVVAAVATGMSGGLLAGLAVAAVGASLLALEANGVNVLGPIMDPIMKGLMAVLEPIGKLLGDAWQYTPIGALVLKLVPPEYEEMAKMIVGMVTAMALLVAGAIVLGGAVGPLLSKIMAKVGEIVSKVVDKLMDKMISPMLEKLNGKFLDTAVGQQLKAIIDQVFKKLADFNNPFKDAFAGPNGQMWLSRLQTAGVAVEFTGTAASSSANIASGAFRYQAAQAMSEVQMIQFISEQLKEALTQTVKAYAEQMQTTTEFINRVLQTQQISEAAANFVSKQRI